MSTKKVRKENPVKRRQPEKLAEGPGVVPRAPSEWVSDFGEILRGEAARQGSERPMRARGLEVSGRENPIKHRRPEELAERRQIIPLSPGELSTVEQAVSITMNREDFVHSVRAMEIAVVRLGARQAFYESLLSEDEYRKFLSSYGRPYLTYYSDFAKLCASIHLTEWNEDQLIQLTRSLTLRIHEFDEKYGEPYLLGLLEYGLYVFGADIPKEGLARLLSSQTGPVIELNSEQFCELSRDEVLSETLKQLRRLQLDAYEKARDAADRLGEGGQEPELPSAPKRPRNVGSVPRSADRHKARKKESKKLFGAYVSEELIDAVRKIAAARGISIQKIVEEMMLSTIAKHGSKEVKERLERLVEEDIQKYSQSRRGVLEPNPR